MSKIYLRTRVGKAIVDATYLALLPHKIFSAMWEYSQSMFAEFWAADRSQVRKFWERLPREDRPDEEALVHTIPVKFFGDGVACLGLNKSWGKSIHAYLLSPMLGGGKARIQQILISALWRSKMTTEAETKWWSILSWSFSALATGRWPSTDYMGHAFPEGSLDSQQANKELAGGWRAKLVALTGDLEFIHTGYQLQELALFASLQQMQVHL